MRGDEFEMLDHRMRAVATELADHAQHHGLGLRTLELDLALAEIGFDAVELAEEIVVPKGAAKLAVGHGTKPRFLLLADHGLDLAVFDRLEFFGGDLAALALGARLLERGGTQEAPDMIGAKRRLGAWHDGSVFAVLVGWVSAPSLSGWIQSAQTRCDHLPHVGDASVPDAPRLRGT